MNKNVVVVIVAAIVVVGGVYAGYLYVNRPPKVEPPCIQPPQISSGVEQKSALEFANALEAAIKDKTDVKSAFENALQTHYAKMSDENVRIFLVTQAIECYLRHGKEGQEAALIMAKSFGEILLRVDREVNKKQGGETPLTIGEQVQLKQSQYGAKAVETLDKLGLVVK